CADEMLRRRRLAPVLERLICRYARTLLVPGVKPRQAEIAKSVDAREGVLSQHRQPRRLDQAALGLCQLAAIVERDTKDAIGDRPPKRALDGSSRDRVPSNRLRVRELAELEAEHCVQDDPLRLGGRI